MSVDLDARLPKTAGHRSNWPDSKTQHRKVGQILWAEAGVEAMKSAMEHGSGVAPTGVKPGSVRAEIADQATI
jgi:hypothetical protein